MDIDWNYLHCHHLRLILLSGISPPQHRPVDLKGEREGGGREERRSNGKGGGGRGGKQGKRRERLSKEG